MPAVRQQFNPFSLLLSEIGGYSGKIQEQSDINVRFWGRRIKIYFNNLYNMHKECVLFSANSFSM